jgi:hypothetical protein
VTISANAGPGLEAEGEAGTDRFARWAIALFFVALFIPGSFYVGVRMTPYRLLLLALALPMLSRFNNDPTLRVTPVDVLVFLFVFWRSLALVVNHQAAELLNAASSFVELFFGYMFGRVFVRSAADYRFFFTCFLLTLPGLPALRPDRAHDPQAPPARHRGLSFDPAPRGASRPADPLRAAAGAGLLRPRDPVWDLLHGRVCKRLLYLQRQISSERPLLRLYRLYGFSCDLFYIDPDDISTGWIDIL